MKMVKFSDLFDFQKKSKIKAGDGLKSNEGLFPFYTSSNELSKSINEFQFTGESLIFGTGGLASIHFEKEKFSVSTDCLVAQPKNDLIINTKFANFYLSGNIHLLEEGFKGAGLKHISKQYISDLKIPLPPLETQKRIAQILDDAKALKQKAELLLKEYDALAQSIFLDMFGDPVKNSKGWEIDVLGNQCEKVQIGPFGSQLHQSDYVEEGFDLINPTNIKNDKIDYLNSVKITLEKFKSLPNYHLKTGDIIMARRGDLSKIGIVSEENKFCGTGSLYVRLGVKMNSTFAFWLLSHKSTIDKLYEKAQGITMANLNKKIILNLPIIIPSTILQNQFAEKITLIEQQKELAKQELKESEDLFNCLMQKAFKGELV
jgi:type I restriction enzyme S subunit